MGHLLKIKCVDSRVNVHILASISVSFRLTTVQVPNLALTRKKRITGYPYLSNVFLYIPMQADLYAPMLGSLLVTCGGVVLPSGRTGRPGAAVRGRRIRILRTRVLPLRSGGGAGRRRLERVIVLSPFPGLELRLLQVYGGDIL